MSMPLQATRARPPAARLSTVRAPAPEARHYPVAGREWPLLILRHTRARRISLRVRAPNARFATAQIALTLPKRAALAQAMQFLQSNTVWLARELGRHAESAPLADGACLACLGETLVFRHSGQLRGLPREEGDTVWLSGPPERFAARLEGYVSQRFETFARAAAAEDAARLGVTLGKVYAKRMTARWGSCNPRGDIALNWRLAFAPREVARYVVAHEVAHRRQMNHSAAFWDEVRALMPDFARHREWLRREGHRLYQWQT